MTSREYKIEILKLFKKSRPQSINKHNLLGKPYVPGTFELELRITFSQQDRLDCLRAFNELYDAGYSAVPVRLKPLGFLQHAFSSSVTCRPG